MLNRAEQRAIGLSGLEITTTATINMQALKNLHRTSIPSIVKSPNRSTRSISIIIYNTGVTEVVEPPASFTTPETVRLPADVKPC